jgi:hypothetical protein
MQIAIFGEEAGLTRPDTAMLCDEIKSNLWRGCWIGDARIVMQKREFPFGSAGCRWRPNSRCGWKNR